MTTIPHHKICEGVIMLCLDCDSDLELPYMLCLIRNVTQLFNTFKTVCYLIWPKKISLPDMSCECRRNSHYKSLSCGFDNTIPGPETIKTKTRSIHKTQTPSRTSVTLRCDFDLSSRSRKLMSLDVAYCIVPWYQIWCIWV